MNANDAGATGGACGGGEGVDGAGVPPQAAVHAIVATSAGGSSFTWSECSRDRAGGKVDAPPSEQECRVRTALRVLVTAAVCLVVSRSAAAQDAPGYEHRVLATSMMHTMELELNRAAEDGVRFQTSMGGEELDSRRRATAGRSDTKITRPTKTTTQLGCRDLCVLGGLRAGASRRGAPRRVRGRPRPPLER